MSQEGAEEKQPKATNAKFIVPSICVIKEAERISSRKEASLFKRTKTQPQANDASTPHKEVRLTKDLPPPAAAEVEKVKTFVKTPHIHTTYVRSVTTQPSSVAGVSSTSRDITEKVRILSKDEDGATPRKPCNPRAILVNIVQKNNPVMKHVRNVPWELGDIAPDFELGRTVCALFLSVRYHSLHPDYIHCRLKELGKQYELRILLVYVDTTESHHALQELTKMALLADLTLILAWSPEEAARYLETYKAYENKPPDLIMERTDSDFSSRVIDSLTTVKKVNKTDAATLLNNFKTMEKLVQASKEELTMCPGLGPQKAQRLYDLFHEPFLRTKKKSKTDL